MLRGSGKRRKKNTDKHLAHWGSDFVPVKTGETQLIAKRTRGGNIKYVLRKANKVNVDGKVVSIVRVKENPANRHFARLGIITKGAIVEVEGGKLVKITSRPGQHNTLNGVWIEEKGEA